MLKLNLESMRRITLCALLIGGGAFFPSSITAANAAEPSKEAQELFKDLASKNKVQDFATVDFEVSLELIKKKEKEMVPVEREMEKHAKEVARLSAPSHPCNIKYTNLEEFQHWKKICEGKAREINSKGRALNREYAPLLRKRNKAINDANKARADLEVAEKGIEKAADALQGIELPSYCRSCQRKLGKKAVACYLQCWDPCKKLVNSCQLNPHGAELIPPQCKCSQLPGGRTYDYERYSGGERVCFCSPQN